jgi:small-conductance mechanosensitive channel
MALRMIALLQSLIPGNAAQSPSEIAMRAEKYAESALRWFHAYWFELAVGSAVGVVFYLALRLLKRKAAGVAARAEHPYSLNAIAMRTLGKTSRFFRLMLSVELVNAIANAPAAAARAIEILFTIAAVFQIAIWLREIILSFLERRISGGDSGHEEVAYETLANARILIRVLVTCALFAIAAIVILDNLGFNVTGLVAGLGVGGIAIGLAAQGIFSDLFAAISIILDKPFKVGDMVSYDTSMATVEKIGMKSTRLRSVTGELLVISNSKLLDLQITNVTNTGYRRTRYPISIIYQTPPELARALPNMLRKIVEGEGAEYVRAGFVGFGDSALNFDLVFDVVSHDYEEVFATRHRIGIAVIEAFEKEGYAFAYPTQTTFTAAPDGIMVMPYAGAPAAAAQNRSAKNVT